MLGLVPDRRILDIWPCLDPSPTAPYDRNNIFPLPSPLQIEARTSPSFPITQSIHNMSTSIGSNRASSHPLYIQSLHTVTLVTSPHHVQRSSQRQPHPRHPQQGRTRRLRYLGTNMVRYLLSSALITPNIRLFTSSPYIETLSAMMHTLPLPSSVQPNVLVVLRFFSFSL